MQCDAVCATCVREGACSTCADGHFRGRDGTCKPPSDAVGCAELDRDVWCLRCEAGFQLSSRECENCSTLFEGCFECTSERRVSCLAGDGVLVDGGQRCVGVAAVERYHRAIGLDRHLLVLVPAVDQR